MNSNKGKKNIKKKRNEKSKKKKTNTLNSYLIYNKSNNFKSYNNNDNIFNLLQKDLKLKYDCNKKKYESIIVEHLLSNSNCRIVSIFKEGMINDYVDEFLHRKYNQIECKERIPKFYNYYKNYLLFFCRPVFLNFKFNKIIQSNGEKKAELYYKNNYQQAKSIDNIKDCGFEESDSDSCSSKSEKKNKKKKIDENIFNDSVKEKLENVTIMTTISTGLNKTVNLNIDNEKLEIFSENKYDKSNDTTVVEFINNYQKELENNKNKNKENKFKKFNRSYILKKNNFSKQKKNKNNKYNNINAVSQKVLSNNNTNKKYKTNKNLKLNEEIKEEKVKKVSREKVKNFIKKNFSNKKEKENKRIIGNSHKETLKINISLKMIHKEYYKLENEMKNNLIKYRNNLKDKYNNKKGMTTLSNTPYNYKSDNKSRNNNNNKILFKQSSMGTVSTSTYGTQNNLNDIKSYNNIFNINNKSYNFSCSELKMRNNKKNMKYISKGNININKKNEKEKKQNKVNNLFIRTDNQKIINQTNVSSNQHNNSNPHKDITNDNINYYYNTTKSKHNKNFIRINKNNKLFKKYKNRNSLKKKNSNNIILSEIKNNKDNNLNISNNNSKEKKIKMKKIRTNNQSRNYANYSSLSNYENAFSTKSIFSRNKSINYNSTNNLNNHNNILSTNKKNKKKEPKRYNTKSNYKKRSIKNARTNLMHISLPIINYDIKFNENKYNSNNKNSRNSFNNNKNKKIYNRKSNNTNSIISIINLGPKYKQLKKWPNSKSINKTEFTNNSSNKNNKKIIASYITKSVTNYSNINKQKNHEK